MVIIHAAGNHFFLGIFLLRRTIDTITEQLQTSHFMPEGYEISFSFAENLDAVNFILSEEERMRLKGRIDRIDTRKEGDQIYVKVIDYKSGNREFQLLSFMSTGASSPRLRSLSFSPYWRKCPKAQALNCSKRVTLFSSTLPYRARITSAPTGFA